MFCHFFRFLFNPTQFFFHLLHTENTFSFFSVDNCRLSESLIIQTLNSDFSSAYKYICSASQSKLLNALCIVKRKMKRREQQYESDWREKLLDKNVLTILFFLSYSSQYIAVANTIYQNAFCLFTILFSAESNFACLINHWVILFRFDSLHFCSLFFLKASFCDKLFWIPPTIQKSLTNL